MRAVGEEAVEAERVAGSSLERLRHRPLGQLQSRSFIPQNFGVGTVGASVVLFAKAKAAPGFSFWTAAFLRPSLFLSLLATELHERQRVLMPLEGPRHLHAFTAARNRQARMSTQNRRCWNPRVRSSNQATAGPSQGLVAET